ncbi:MAG: hypothetical protein SGI83_05640 [Bacteroidota bacterium]|nr:hypothetical protein [Bacteroidota bacterium]
MHIIFLVSATLIYGCSYANPAMDSLPGCILKMKQKDSLLIVEKYDYKGQQWYGISRMLTDQEKKEVNYIHTIKFYNPGCNLIASWRTGGNGIIRVNAILPDSNDKTKIKKVEEKVPKKTMAVDSLPSCILNMKKDSFLIVDEYDYKGQQWFGISSKLTEEDNMFIIKFYNPACKLVATWHGGTNRVLPDSIDRTRLLNIEKVKAPETILTRAIKNDALSISEYEYLGQTLYFLNERTDRFNPNAQKPMIVVKPYYDKNGRVIIAFKRATSSSFLRTQGWQPNTVQQKSLQKKGIIWYNLQPKNWNKSPGIPLIYYKLLPHLHQ